MKKQVSDLSQQRHEILEILGSFEGEVIDLSRIVEKRDAGREATRRLLKRMHEDGLVNFETSYQGSRVTLTDTGASMLEQPPYPGGNVGGDVGSIRLHGLMIEGRIQNSFSLPENWIGVLQEREDVEFKKINDNDWMKVRDLWVARFHKDSITFQLRDGCSIYAESRAEALRKAHRKADSIVSWVEDILPGNVSIQPRYHIRRQEIAYEHHHLAELADELTDIPLDRFQITDKDLMELALELDASPGFPEKEAEGKNAEEVAQRIENEMEEFVNHPEALEFRHHFEREASVQGMDGQEAVHRLRKVEEMDNKVDNALESISKLSEGVNEMAQVVEQNQASGSGQIQQQVMEMKSTQEQLREKIESNTEIQESNNAALSHLSQQLEKINQSIQEQSRGYDDPVQEIFMEVRDDPEFRDPFFHAQGGHLMAFRKDGSGCETFLKKREIDRLRGN